MPSSSSNLFFFIKRSLNYFIKKFVSVIKLFRKVRFYFYTNSWVSDILGEVYVSGLGRNVRFGPNTTLYPRTVLEVGETAALSVGDYFTLSYGALIACHQSIVIGRHVMIGEYTSVRDTTHSYQDTSTPFVLQDDRSEPVTIGNNVWIGRGCIVMPGSVIEDNVIIGANSVVRGVVPGSGIYAGSPLVLLKPLQ